MSREKKKPKQQKVRQEQPGQQGQPTAAVEAQNQPHNVKQESLGQNTKRG